jgi:hypothetical protein
MLMYLASLKGADPAVSARRLDEWLEVISGTLGDIKGRDGKNTVSVEFDGELDLAEGASAQEVLAPDVVLSLVLPPVIETRQLAASGEKQDRDFLSALMTGLTLGMLLFGKILGKAAASIPQYGVWISITALFLAVFGPRLGVSSPGLSSFSSLCRSS